MGPYTVLFSSHLIKFQWHLLERNIPWSKYVSGLKLYFVVLHRNFLYYIRVETPVLGLLDYSTIILVTSSWNCSVYFHLPNQSWHGDILKPKPPICCELLMMFECFGDKKKNVTLSSSIQINVNECRKNDWLLK